jgi:hypothetical protein
MVLPQTFLLPLYLVHAQHDQTSHPQALDEMIFGSQLPRTPQTELASDQNTGHHSPEPDEDQEPQPS